ncbi:hypothetical protein [Albimonas pacifica]|uniref:Uncharacterized protein n=1 Tax=Albimonas pacifica TaxID=1114924 RepID=A0A1I3I4J8_9RHOB|nr:hypothetical protein [Albimonas pacifica]SFI42713.1 hypothetical protein SAMN05216258_106329 [Albimonas pacifica]
MADLTKAGARTLIEAAEAREIARLARPDDPDLMERGALEDALGEGALLLDGLRRRPRWFDGRFLTGADLTRDQDYVRQRQADLARASGTGVTEGLEVSASSDSRGAGLVIEPGHGITPSGELVMIGTRREVALLDLGEVRRLNAVLGLNLEPRQPLGRRSGLFVLGLRPVEWTANEIAAYPTSIGGRRKVEDGDVIEATAITLVPWKIGETAGLAEARRLAAREIFLGEPAGMPQDILPIAMVALDRGSLRWIDRAMVRRETGADTPLQVSLGARPRALAEAFLIQHRDHLAEVMAARGDAGRGGAFAASQSFAALPPSGPMPAAAILPLADGFRQLWFPPEVEVTLAFAPEDELAAIAEESLALPPLDLVAEGALEGVGVSVIAPVSRARLARFEAALAGLSVKAAPGAEAAGTRTPADGLTALLGRRARRLTPTTAPDGLTAAERAELNAWIAAWEEAVAALPTPEGGAPTVWYARRRAVPREAALTGVAVPIAGDDARADAAVRDRAEALGLRERLEAVAERATSAARYRISAFLSAPAMLASAPLTGEAVSLLEAATPEREGTTPPTRGDTGDTASVRESAAGALRESAAGALREAASGSSLASRIDALSALRGAGGASPARVAVAAPVADLRGATAPAAVTAGHDPMELRRSALTLRTGAERIAVSRILVAAEADDGPAVLTEADVLDVASDFDLADLGLGLARLEAAMDDPLAPLDAAWIGEAGHALDLDRLGLRLSGEVLEKTAAGVFDHAKARDAEALAKLIDQAL